MTYTMGSLCTGAAMLDGAVEAAYGPARRVFHAEVDVAASTILAARYADVPNLGDITGGAPVGCPDDAMRQAAHAKWSQVGHVDVLTAGWPCQVASLAGRRRGSADDRYLWPAVAGCIEAVEPEVFVGENVPGLLTVEDGAMFGTVLADLDSLGYTVRWTARGACTVGAAHHRHRVFIVATRGAETPSGQPVGWRRGGGPWLECAGSLFGDHAPFGGWPAAGVAAGGYLWQRSAAVCGAPSFPLFPTPTARDGDGRGEGSPGYWERKRAEGWTGGAPLGAVVRMLPSDGWGGYAPAVDRWERMLGRDAPPPATSGPKGGPELAARFVEWLQGQPDGHVSDLVTNDAALRILGNGVMRQSATAAITGMLPALTVGAAA